jgi:hypothetical protein
MSDTSGVQVSADNDRSHLRTWHEWEVDGGVRRVILCVESALELRPGFAGFDPTKLETLISDATDMMRTSGSPIDAIRIVPGR